MKKNISISIEENLIDSFTSLANDFGTNRTNLLSMMMTEVIKSRNIHFSRSYLDIEFENFTEKENNSLISKGSPVVKQIFNTLDSQIGK